MPNQAERSAELPLPDILFAQAMGDLQAGRLSLATSLFERCIARDPGHAEAHVHLGEAHRQAGDLDAALACCDGGLAINPMLPSGRLIRGIVRRDLKQLDGAIDDLGFAVGHFGHVAAVHAVLGFALSDGNRDGEAIDRLQHAAALDPSLSDVHRILGDLFQASGNNQAALHAYQTAIQLKPDDAVTYGNLGRLLLAMGAFPLSAAMSRMATKLSPDLVAAYCYLGAALRHQGSLSEAADAYREALARRPDDIEALSELCALRRQTCDWAGLEADDETVRQRSYRSNQKVTPFAILVSTPSPAENLLCSRVWAQALRQPSEQVFTHGPRPEGNRHRLRIGYLSADFRAHATAGLIAEMLELHDRDRFQVVGYSLATGDDSPIRQRLIRSFDTFVDLASLAHRDAAQRIHADGIDILIDLKGYTGDARTEILAYRPAPIQVNYLGYPGTMGADFIDYIIGDPIVAPMAHQAFFDEKIVHLPHCYQPNDRTRSISEVRPSRAACGLPETGFVFCCINNSYKITPQLFDIWMRLLDGVPGSVLWLLETNATVAGNLHREATGRGVSPARLIFAPRLPVDAHLARLGLADLFLDTLPVNAHTTASEALWSGLPVLTCLGDGFAGRVAASLLEAIDMPDLVTTTLADYEATALRLARDPTAMVALRDRLRSNRIATPLFDTPRYVRHLEAALLQMTALREAGRPPESFAVPA